MKKSYLITEGVDYASLETDRFIVIQEKWRSKMATESVSFWLSRLKAKTPEKDKRFFRYQLHQFIWQAFASHPTGSKQPFLFTFLDQNEPNNLSCLVQSTSQPDWSSISEKDNQGVLLTGHPEVKSVNFDISEGDSFFLQIHLCPIKNVTIHDRQFERGLKAPIFKHFEIERYLSKKAEQHGYQPIREEFSIEKIFIRRKKEPNVKDIKISKCRYNAIVKITDNKKFKPAIINGIGSKKIFGFGMPMLMPCSFGH